MKRVILLALLCAACAPPITAAPPRSVVAPASPAPRPVAKPPCVIPTPPTADDLAKVQATGGLVGQKALLLDYAKKAHDAKAACH
jgi:hypothetical protein